MTATDSSSATRREAIFRLLALPAALLSPGAGAAPAAGLGLELLVFRQPGAAAGAGTAGIPTPGTPGPVLGPLLPGLRRGGYTLLAATARTLAVGAGATGALPFEELAPAPGLRGQLAVTRGQLLTVHLVAADAACATGGAIDERRRVKFGDRHYFDSPCIGAILAITPLEAGPAAGSPPGA
jgi:hypothetical protein